MNFVIKYQYRTDLVLNYAISYQGMIMTIYLNGAPVSGLAAESHFVEWCLGLENGGKRVPRTSLSAISFFQDAVFGGNIDKLKVLNQSGIKFH